MNIRSPKRMAEGLRRWGQLVLQQARIAEENQYQGGLLEPTPTLSREQLFAALGSDSNPTEQAIAGRVPTNRPSRWPEQAPDHQGAGHWQHRGDANSHCRQAGPGAGGAGSH